MIISHMYKFIFIKTRKTAGTSIELALAPLCGPEDVLTELGEPEDNKKKYDYPGGRNYQIPRRHWSLKDTLKIPKRGLPKFESHSPAEYVRAHIDPKIWKEYFTFCFDRHPFDRIVSQYFWNTRETGLDLETYLKKAEIYRLSNWDMYAAGGRVIVDHVAKYENLAEELEFIRQRIGLEEPFEMARAKTAHRPEKSRPKDILTPEIREQIAVTCAREARYLGYDLSAEETAVSAVTI